MSVVGIDIMGKRGERRKCLPLEVRIAMHDDVLRLHREGLSYSQLMEKIYEKYGRQLPLSTISYWVNKIHNPLGRVNKFDGKPSPELAYIIGVIHSDGYKYIGKKKSQYFLRLAVNDREFAEKFAECLTKILGRKKPYKPFFYRKTKRWIVAGGNVLLFKFLDRPLEELKPTIEYNKDCVSAFLRALFDAEGSIYVKIRGGRRERKLRLYNTNKELLVYIQYLLKRFFDIDSTLHLSGRRGSIKHFPNGKIAKTTKNYYLLYIHARSLLNFYKHIGFTIKRKQQTLIKAIK
jgi:intein-encoded DNA endonuclease-like protein